MAPFKQHPIFDDRPSELSERPTAGLPHYAGHRERLRKRFRDIGGDTLADYEILELVLFRALPRRDTKPIAKTLLNKFGSISAIFGAPEKRLMEVDGVGQSVATEIKLLQALSVRLAKSEISNKPLLSSWSSVLEYCHAAMAHEEREEFRVLFLDKRNQLISDEIQQRGTVDHTPVYPREVVKRALELAATALILVHNHPSGDPRPSSTDIEMTKRIIKITEPLNITVHDHIIIARNGHCSLKGEQFI